MTFGAAVLAAQDYGAASLSQPAAVRRRLDRRDVRGSARRRERCCRRWATGDEQTEELRETIARSDAELALIGTPIDLRRLIDFDRPALRVKYRL